MGLTSLVSNTHDGSGRDEREAAEQEWRAGRRGQTKRRDERRDEEERWRERMERKDDEEG